MLKYNKNQAGLGSGSGFDPSFTKNPIKQFVRLCSSHSIFKLRLWSHFINERTTPRTFHSCAIVAQHGEILILNTPWTRAKSIVDENATLLMFCCFDKAM